MPTVLPVKFAYAARELWFDENGSKAQEGDHVICSTERGTEIGLACAAPRKMTRAQIQQTIGNATLKPVLRVADDFDLERADDLARQGDEAMPIFRHFVSECDLDMKPVGVEYLFGGEKVVCYFSAEERVDFRQLVRDLGHELHERIDMRQIGVREESAIVGGFGHCGQELCCSRFGLSFEPVSIRMAKEQDLPLTSNKISGACGRLMCCLRYEFDAYRDFKGRAPKRSDIIETPLGKAKVVEYDTPKEQIALRLENGKVVRVPLAEMETSDAAKKRAQERNCPVRPDTVVRKSLERLSSPDVQMALAELDRKMGVGVMDSFEDIDIFVENKPKRRRSRSKGAATPQPGQNQQAQQKQQRDQAQQAQAQDASKHARRRRRRRSGSESAPASPQPLAQHMTSKPQKSASPEAQRQSASAATTGTEPRRRRHHKSASAAAPTSGTASLSHGASQPRSEQKSRRRPGDRAGQQAQQQNQQGAAKAPQKALPSQPKHMAPEGSQAQDAQKRRRRRRRKSPGGAEGGAAEQAGNQ